jgi:hypothetical protein
VPDLRRLATVASVADCEVRDDWFFAQDVNAWSALAYVALGLFIVLAVARRRVPPAFVALGVATALEGVGSLLYHGSGGRAAHVLHDGALVAVLGFVAGWHVGRLAGTAARTAFVGVGTGLAVGVVAGATSSVLTNGAVVVGVVVVVVAEVLARHRRLVPVWTAPLLLLAAAAVVAWVLGTPDSPACSSESWAQPHALWHVLSAVLVAGWMGRAVEAHRWSPRQNASRAHRG